jgi:nucleoside-diphosphate-sugar epimerase
MARLVFGCGYLGMRVAQLWLHAGEEIVALTRRPTRALELRSRGIRPIVGDITTPFFLPEVDRFQTVLFAVGFDRLAGKDIQEVYVGGLENALKALPDSVERFIYVSSTGVYGQNQHEWVDEDSVCEPKRRGGLACLAAEQLLESHELGKRAIVLRLAGIYGPERIPQLAALREGRPVHASPHGFVNLIHVDDAARVVVAAEKRAQPPCKYVVADGQPVRRGDFYREIARLLAAPPPRFVDPPPGSSSEERGASSKRVQCVRMKQELGVSLVYPSYCEGLAAILAGGMR